MGFWRRHDLFLVVGKDADQCLGLGRLLGIPCEGFDRVFADIESEISLLVVLIWTVAEEAVVGENWEDFPSIGNPILCLKKGRESD